MPKQDQTQTDIDKKQKPDRRQTTVASEQIGEQVGLAEMPPGPEAAADQPDVQAQAARLNDPRVQMLQRQMMAGQISQRHGNMHMSRVMRAMKPRGGATPVQTKLTVNEPDDQYEQEADQVAETVTQTSTAAPPPVIEEENPFLPAASLFPLETGQPAETALPDDLEAGVQNLQGGGHPLPDEERSFFEDNIGADFSDVRIHTGDDAVQTSQDLNARAYTVGTDIAFNAGEYQPGTDEGRQLLAHELTHVVQQGGGGELRRKTDEETEGAIESPAEEVPVEADGAAEAGIEESVQSNEQAASTPDLTSEIGEDIATTDIESSKSEAAVTEDVGASATPETGTESVSEQSAMSSTTEMTAGFEPTTDTATGSLDLLTPEVDQDLSAETEDGATTTTIIALPEMEAGQTQAIIESVLNDLIEASPEPLPSPEVGQMEAFDFASSDLAEFNEAKIEEIDNLNEASVETTDSTEASNQVVDTPPISEPQPSSIILEEKPILTEEESLAPETGGNESEDGEALDTASLTHISDPSRDENLVSSAVEVGEQESDPDEVQAQAIVSASGDVYEQEADRTADTVMRTPDKSIKSGHHQSGDNLYVQRFSLNPLDWAEDILDALKEDAETEEGELKSQSADDSSELVGQAAEEDAAIQSEAGEKSVELQDSAAETGLELQTTAGEEGAGIQTEGEEQGANLQTTADEKGAEVQAESETFQGDLQGQWGELESETETTVAGVQGDIEGNVEEYLGEAMEAEEGLQEEWTAFQEQVSTQLADAGAEADELTQAPQDESAGDPCAQAEEKVGWGKWIADKLISGFELAKDGWNGFKNLALETWDQVRQKGKEWLTYGVDLVNTAWSNIQNTWNTLSDGAVNAWNGLKTLAVTAWTDLEEIGTAAWTGLKETATSAWTGLKDTGTAAWTGLKETATSAWTGVKDTGTAAWTGLKETGESVASAFLGIADATVSGLRGDGGSIMQWFAGIVNAVVDGVQSVGGSAWTGLKNTGTAAWGGLKNTATSAWTGLKDTGTAAWTGLKDTAASAWTGLKETGTTAWNTLKEWGTRAWNGLKVLGDGAVNVSGLVWTGVQKGWNTLTGGVEWVFNKTLEFGQNAVNKMQEWGLLDWQGIQDNWHAFKKEVKEIAEGVLAVFEDTIYTDKYEDLAGTQYIITEGKVYQVRPDLNEETGEIDGYIVIDEVIGYDEDGRPELKCEKAKNEEECKQEFDKLFEDWEPTVTHMTGIRTNPEEGIQETQDKFLGHLDGENRDILYTYSPTQGDVTDLFESLGSKAGLVDEETRQQEYLIYDAVKDQRHMSVSAHSRGSIKTDNAYRNARQRLIADYIPEYLDSPEANQAAEEAKALAIQSNSTVSPDIAGEIARKTKAKELATRRADEELQEYIQLVYSGNAVEHPVPEAELVVAEGDWVPFLFGSYGEKGGNENITKIDGVGWFGTGSHDFGNIYAPCVADKINEFHREAEEIEEYPL